MANLFRFKQRLLIEGIHDQGTHKLIFMAGGTGNGKDFVMKKTMGGLPLKEINSDHAFSYLMDKKGLSKKMPPEEFEQREPLRHVAKNVTQNKLSMAFDGRQGLIINGTADDKDKIALMKRHFERMGYDTAMVFVHAPNDVSRQRNIERGQKGDRQVPEHIRAEKWQTSTEHMGHYKKLFGDNFHLVDTGKDAFGSPEEREDRESQHMEVFRKIKNFVETPSRMASAREWYSKQAEMRGLDKEKIISHHFARQTPHDRRMMTPPREDVPVDHEKMSNYTLANRKKFGDKKAEGLLTDRQSKKEANLKR